MRTLRATRIALEAEALRLRLQARRMAVRAVLGVVALGFLACALALAHVAAWDWLRLRFGLMGDTTAALLAAADLLAAGVLAGLASRLGPGAAEIEARLVRRQAWGMVTQTVVWTTIAARLLRLLRRR